MITNNLALAVNGGFAVRQEAWPDWPAISDDGIAALANAARSRRWASSGFATGRRSLDQVFAERFAGTTGMPYCLPTDHGSSALTIALEGLGIGFGDEVIVPGLTWVACASAVLRVNARPVLVDIDADTLCIDPAAVEAAITSRTAAILIVHLYSCMADVTRIEEIARRYGLFVVEDAAQAHGALWGERKAGSFGDAGVFSMQQGKVMTCGEGGALVTSDANLYGVFEQLRNDGRRYSTAPSEQGRMELIETAGLLGANRAPSEFQMAVLLDGLTRLEAECDRRSANAELLDELLREIEGYVPMKPAPENTRRSYYHFPIRIDREAFGQRSIEVLANALSAELGTWVHPPYPPLDRHPLLNAPRGRRYAAQGLGDIRVPSPLTVSARASESVLLLHHSVLLADAEAMRDVAAALRKVRDHVAELPRAHL